MNRIRGRSAWIAAAIGASLAALLGALLFLVYLRSPQRGLPYRDAFAQGNSSEWTAIGGAWQVDKGTMRNDSDERGAKLLTGSTHWRNYSVEADVALPGISGDAGLIIRSGDEEEGVNSYSGYYAGIRDLDNALVLGRAEHGWVEVNHPNVAPEGIVPFHWYHLKLTAFECEIAVQLTGTSQAKPLVLSIHDQQCAPAGRMGLRSYSSGGIWRNVSARVATRRDLDEMLWNAMEQPPSPGSVVDYREQQFTHPPAQAAQPPALESPPQVTQSIEDTLIGSPVHPPEVTVRGVVILIMPGLFVQDSTGGVYIPHPGGQQFKVGDEVEVTGRVHPAGFSAHMDPAAIKVLWAREPQPPVSVTASQASTGRFDATFVEVQGKLVAKNRGPGNSLTLDMDEGSQSFRVFMSPGRGDFLFSRLKPDSRLRLRGVCVSDPAFTGNATPFVLLLRSNDDLDVLAGPPRWNTGHLIAIVIGGLLLALIVNSVFHRIAQWRLQAVIEERQRLAHEMHDTLAQSFAGIGFQLQAIRNSIGEGSPGLVQQLDFAQELVRHSHEEARRSIATLRPEALESEDFVAALELNVRRMIEGGPVDLVVERVGEQRPVPLRIADPLFRIGQEAVANALRHASPARLVIRLSFPADTAQLEIEDDGVGFVPSATQLGFGIRGMRRRAHAIAAAFEIDSALGAGTRIRVSAPLPPRIKLTAWPILLWRYAKGQVPHAQSTGQQSARLYRR